MLRYLQGLPMLIFVANNGVWQCHHLLPTNWHRDFNDQWSPLGVGGCLPSQVPQPATQWVGEPDKCLPQNLCLTLLDKDVNSSPLATELCVAIIIFTWGWVGVYPKTVPNTLPFKQRCQKLTSGHWAGCRNASRWNALCGSPCMSKIIIVFSPKVH